MAVVSERPPANAFVRTMRKVYNPVGFSKGYNFILWFIFAGAMMGFCLARTTYLDFHGVVCNADGDGANHSAPGECWAYNTKTVHLIGIQIHLYTVIPAGILVCFQFVPVIRHKIILFHRINGYLVIVLSIVGTVGALMVARVSFGGGIDIQTFCGVLAIMFLGSMALAIYNIKMLQIEQHRAWMLRAWFYGGIIITARLILILSALILPATGPYYHSMPCEKIESVYESRDEFINKWPECSDPETWVAVEAGMGESAEGSAAALNFGFGSALWLALTIHAIGVEVYLRLTPAEFERLRNVSHQRQLEAGFKNPGRAGLTADRLGDSEAWVPAQSKEVTENNTSTVVQAVNKSSGSVSSQ